MERHSTSQTILGRSLTRVKTRIGSRRCAPVEDPTLQGTDPGPSDSNPPNTLGGREVACSVVLRK